MTKRVRKPVFNRRSSLPASAACVVANGVREALARLFAKPVELRVLEPSIPTEAAWHAIVRDALLYRVCGSVADAVVVLRPADALALTAGLFGERPSGCAKALSPFERDVLDRTIDTLAAHLGSVCGTRESHAIESIAKIQGFTTYFELSLVAPIVARVGIALSRDPAGEPSSRIEALHLAEVPIPVHARLDLGAMSSTAVAALTTNAVLPVRADELHRCSLVTCGRTLARGTCGLANGRSALRIGATSDGA
ncbi:MAG TPA: hypothetical protein VGI19_12905 [Candidatus Cybelea sp.]|jgi:hypothetical protein